MTIARNADRPSRKVQFTLSPEARAALAAVPSGMRSQWVDEAILEKRLKEAMWWRERASGRKGG